MNTYFPRLAAALACAVLVTPAWADIEASAAWTRETVAGMKMGVGYLDLRNTGDQARELVQATSPAAGRVTIHQSSVSERGVARMTPLASLPLPAGQVVHLAPGGLHLMLEDLRAPLVAGSKVPVTLQFSDGEQPLTVQLEVRPLVEEDAPSHEQAAGHEHEHEHMHH